MLNMLHFNIAAFAQQRAALAMLHEKQDGSSNGCESEKGRKQLHLLFADSYIEEYDFLSITSACFHDSVSITFCLS